MTDAIKDAECVARGGDEDMNADEVVAKEEDEVARGDVICEDAGVWDEALRIGNAAV